MRIRSYLEEKLKNNFLKNVLTLLTGSVIGQIIVFSSIPILTRLFSEEAFGIFALFSSTILLLKTLASLNFELAIILPERDKDAINIFTFNIILIVLFSAFLCLMVFLFKTNLAALFKIEKIANFIYFIPLSVFLTSCITALEYWNNRNNKFKNITTGTVSKSASMSIFQIFTGVSSFKYIGLIPGMIVGQFFNFILLIKLSLKSVFSLKNHISIKRMLFLASKYRDIPIFNTISTFINTLSNELPMLLITSFFGLGTAGVYGLATKVSKAPPGIIGQSVSQVFFREASLIYNSNKNLYAFIIKTYKTLFVTALFIFIPLCIISFYLNIIFGNNWNEVGIQVRILLPWLFIMFLNSPISSLTTILNKQKTILILNILLLISRFLAIYYGYILYNSIFITLILFSSVGVLFNLINLIYFLIISKQSLNQQSKVYK